MKDAQSVVTVHSFGPLLVTLGGQTVGISSKKARALLAYLVFDGANRHQRDRVAQRFWPLAEPKLARASLRQTIFELKKALQNVGADYLQSTGETIFFELACITTDVDVLLAKIDGGQLADLGQLHSVNFDSFLSDFDDLGAEFEDWVLEKRRKVESDVKRALKKALERDQHTQDAQFEIAQALYALDTYDEQAVRALMRIYRDRGEVHSALRVYSDLYDRLSEEMDVEPSIETQDLVVAIKLAEPDRADTSPAQAQSVAEKSAATVAILPFEALGPDAPDKFAILGLLDEITCKMASLQAVGVISSNSTRQYLGQPQSIAQLRQDLGANYVVVGSLRSRSGRIAITVQVVDAQTQQILDARVHEGAADDIFNLHSDIAAGISNSIAPNLSRAELSRTRDYPIEALAPYQLVMKAKEAIFALSHNAFSQAQAYLDEAIAKVPHFAPAHALKAEWHSIRIWQRWSPDPVAENAALESCALRAISLSANEPRVMALLGHNRVLMHKRFSEAEDLFAKAIDLSPNDSETLIWTVPAYTFMGQAARAVENGKQAILLSPLDPFHFRNLHFLSIAQYASGNFQEAADMGLQCFRDNANYISNIRMTVAALNAADRQSEIAPLLDQHMAILPDFSLRNYGDGPPFKDSAMRAALLADLKAGGLPV